jgi:hypothetical protein
MYFSIMNLFFYSGMKYNHPQAKVLGLGGKKNKIKQYLEFEFANKCPCGLILFFPRIGVFRIGNFSLKNKKKKITNRSKMVIFINEVADWYWSSK